MDFQRLPTQANPMHEQATLGGTVISIGPDPRGPNYPQVLALWRHGMPTMPTFARFVTDEAAKEAAAMIREGIDQASQMVGQQIALGVAAQLAEVAKPKRRRASKEEPIVLLPSSPQHPLPPSTSAIRQD
jgi:hypothetical protein